MKTKSLLLGSAAALVAVSGARAADAIIIPEPEVVEYVRVCDAAGTGYFYIPGTETCLKIGGYVRFEIDHDAYSEDKDDDGGDAWVDFVTKADITVASWTDSEIGAVKTFFELNQTIDGTDSGTFAIDSAYLSFAGLKMGYFGSFLDNGINGEVDESLLSDKFNSIQYTGTAGAVSFGVQVDQLDDDVWYNGANDLGMGVQGMIGLSAGAVDFSFVAAYDIDTEGYVLNARASTDLGMGTLQGRFIYQNDQWSWYNGRLTGWDNGSYLQREWTANVSYAAALNDKLTITPGFTWHKFYGDDTMWVAGVTADYNLTDTLAIKANVEYVDFNDEFNWNDNSSHGWRNFLRFQASF